MATMFSHLAVGATLSALAPRTRHRVKLAVVMATLSAMPDLDVIAFRFDIPYASPWGHRGFTHSLTFAALVAIVTAWLFMRVPRTNAAHRLHVTLLLFVACASHGVLDALTDAGLGIGFFIPFESTRYFFDFRPLATSPIGVAAFFRESSLRILLNELVWIGLPCVALLVAVALRSWALGRRAPVR
ncbi:MAG: metal-dependent hydrolase [Gammaproteobacteria bacterium]